MNYVYKVVRSREKDRMRKWLIILLVLLSGCVTTSKQIVVDQRMWETSCKCIYEDKDPVFDQETRIATRTVRKVRNIERLKGTGPDIEYPRCTCRRGEETIIDETLVVFYHIPDSTETGRLFVTWDQYMKLEEDTTADVQIVLGMLAEIERIW